MHTVKGPGMNFSVKKKLQRPFFWLEKSTPPQVLSTSRSSHTSCSSCTFNQPLGQEVYTAYNLCMSWTEKNQGNPLSKDIFLVLHEQERVHGIANVITLGSMDYLHLSETNLKIKLLILHMTKYLIHLLHKNYEPLASLDNAAQISLKCWCRPVDLWTNNIYPAILYRQSDTNLVYISSLLLPCVCHVLYRMNVCITLCYIFCHCLYMICLSRPLLCSKHGVAL